MVELGPAADKPQVYAFSAGSDTRHNVGLPHAVTEIPYLRPMKYRRLRPDELRELEREFVRFLAANTITADEWERLKEHETERAEKMLDIFSDFVFDQTLQRIEYLEFKSPKDIKTFHCLDRKIILNGLRVEGSSALDFTQDLSAEQMLSLVRLAEAQVKLYTAEKGYRPNRERELFNLLESGARISRDGKLFQLLEELKNKP